MNDLIGSTDRSNSSLAAINEGGSSKCPLLINLTRPVIPHRATPSSSSSVQRASFNVESGSSAKVFGKRTTIQRSRYPTVVSTDIGITLAENTCVANGLNLKASRP